MRLFSFSRANFGSNQKPSTNPRYRNSEKFEDDWFTSSTGASQPPSGVIGSKEDRNAMQNTPPLNQLPSPLEHTLDGHTGQGTTDSRPAPAPHILALSSFAEDSASVFPKMDGGIGETPIPPIRALVSQKRSGRSSFFAFSSNRKSRHGTPIIHMPQSQQSTRLKAHLADPSDIPSPLRTDNEDYYYCQYSPSQASSPAIPRLDTSSLFPVRKRRSMRSQSHHVTLDSDSQQSSPINQSSPSHSHPHVYPSSIFARAQSSAVPQDTRPAQGSSSQDGQEGSRGEKSGIDEPDILLFPIPPPQPPATPRRNSPTVGIRPPQPRGLLRSSFSVPNLSSAARVADGQTSATKTLASGKRRDVLLTAGNWCDTLIFPRPRLKVQNGPISSRRPVISPPSTPIPGDDPAVTAFPRRPATASATLIADSVTPNTQSPAALAEAAMLNSAVDTVPEEQQPAPVADRTDRPDDRPLLPSPPPSVEQYVSAMCVQSLANIGSLGFSRKAKISSGCANDGERRPPNRWATSTLGRSRARVPNRFRRSRCLIGTSPTQRKARATLSILLPVLYSVAKM